VTYLINGFVIVNKLKNGCEVKSNTIHFEKNLFLSLLLIFFHKKYSNNCIETIDNKNKL
jgi:hypothetical protein